MWIIPKMLHTTHTHTHSRIHFVYIFLPRLLVHSQIEYPYIYHYKWILWLSNGAKRRSTQQWFLYFTFSMDVNGRQIGIRILCTKHTMYTLLKCLQLLLNVTILSLYIYYIYRVCVCCSLFFRPIVWHVCSFSVKLKGVKCMKKKKRSRWVNTHTHKQTNNN